MYIQIVITSPSQEGRKGPTHANYKHLQERIEIHRGTL